MAQGQNPHAIPGLHEAYLGFNGIEKNIGPRFLTSAWPRCGGMLVAGRIAANRHILSPAPAANGQELPPDSTLRVLSGLRML
jgi:hypothetical protein